MNSNRIENQLSTYDIYELAAMYHYIYPTLLPSSQEKVDKYLITIGVSKNELLVYLNNIQKKKKFLTSEQFCPRCFSNKIIILKEELWRTMSNARDRKIFFDAVYCKVCGFKGNDLNKEIEAKDIKSFLKSLFNFLCKVLKPFFRSVYSLHFSVFP